MRSLVRLPTKGWQARTDGVRVEMTWGKKAKVKRQICKTNWNFGMMEFWNGGRVENGNAVIADLL
ncbi:MAG: hypothetical protein K8F60_12160 [Melioribacteraceae bacterium]|nr:hypothetical protein [Melioribacteraceae bacterium]